MRSFILILVAALLVSNTQGRAQSFDPLDAMNARAGALIDSTMSQLNLRAERFNEETSTINRARPLDAGAFTPEKIVENKAKVKDFLEYLEVYRSLSTKSRKDVEDSVETMRRQMPSRIRKSYLQDFLDAYHSDQSAFDKYTLALTNVYTTVSDVLNFLSTSKVKAVDGKLSFDDKKEYDQYNDLMNAINAANKKLIDASALSQKATLKAGEQMQQSYPTSKK